VLILAFCVKMSPEVWPLSLTRVVDGDDAAAAGRRDGCGLPGCAALNMRVRDGCGPANVTCIILVAMHSFTPVARYGWCLIAIRCEAFRLASATARVANYAFWTLHSAGLADDW